MRIYAKRFVDATLTEPFTTEAAREAHAAYQDLCAGEVSDVRVALELVRAIRARLADGPPPPSTPACPTEGRQLDLILDSEVKP